MKKLLAVVITLGLWHSAVRAHQPTDACPTVGHVDPMKPPKEVDGLKLVLTERGTINFSDDKDLLVEGVLPTELRGYASNEILNVTSYTVLQLKKNPCFVLVCGKVCAWMKVSDGPCPAQ